MSVVGAGAGRCSFGIGGGELSSASFLSCSAHLALHIQVDQHAEELRHHFVSHQGQKNIEVVRPGFTKGSPLNDWPGVFPEFSEKITAHIGEANRDLIECNFSTTGPVQRIVSHICLMDTVQHYFTCATLRLL